MSIDVGTVGAWARESDLSPELAVELEQLGYGTIWVGGSPGGSLDGIETLLAATDHVVVATGIVNMWKDDAAPIAAAYHRIADRYPNRFLLGLGIGHPEATRTYAKPYATIVDYLDQLDAAGVPVEGRALAALGPRVLALAGQRTAGAHPYLTTPEHTRQARELLGPGPLLAPEQKLVLDTDEDHARAVGRATVRYYLGLSNYVSNLRRLGWTDEDFADGGSDRLIDALAPHGDAEAIASAARAHLEAGADHIAVQILGDDPRPGYRAVADHLINH
jgi:probable F420-dependent oxidoreductase